METKPFYRSWAFWGAAAYTVSTVLPRYAPILSGGIQAAGQIAGIIAGLYGARRKDGGQPLTILPQPKE